MKYTRRLIAVFIPVAMYASSGFQWNPADGFDTVLGGMLPVFVAQEVWDWKLTAEAADWLANLAIVIAIGALAIGYRKAAIAVAASGCFFALLLLPAWGKYMIRSPGDWLWGWSIQLAPLLAAIFLLKRAPVPFAEDFGPMQAPDSHTPSPT